MAIHVRLSASMLRILILLLSPRPFAVALPSAATSYAKVSRNGQLARSSHDSFPWFNRFQASNDTGGMDGGNIGASDIAITAPPVYLATSKAPKLKKGEAIDHPSVPRYSTLDYEMIAKLNAGKKQIQQRFNPPAAQLFNDHSPSNGRPQNDRPKKGAGTSNSGDFPRVNSSSFLPGPISLPMYEYGPPDFLEDKPPSKPMTSVPNYPPMDTDDKMPNGYEPPSSNYNAGNGASEMGYPDFDVPPPYEDDESMKKPDKYASRPFSYDHHDFHHEVIYDHVPPEYHEHHVEITTTTTTTQEPEMNDQRLDKRPYSYYFIGKKLWYVPLYFSIYFIVYIAALILKSIARHKINFPAALTDAVGHSKRSEPDEGWWNFAERILDGVERFAEVAGSKETNVG